MARVALAVVAILDGAIGAYLTWERHRGRIPACPIGGSGCATVQHSRFAELAGVPVSALGLAGAAALLATAAVRAPSGRLAAAVVALCGALFSAYLTYREAFTIRAYCAWCLTSAALWVVAAAIALWSVDARET